MNQKNPRDQLIVIVGSILGTVDNAQEGIGLHTYVDQITRQINQAEQVAEYPDYMYWDKKKELTWQTVTVYGNIGTICLMWNDRDEYPDLSDQVRLIYTKDYLTTVMDILRNRIPESN